MFNRAQQKGDEDDADDDEPPLPPSPGLPRRQSIEEYLSPTYCNNDKSGQGAATFYMDENDENNNILDYYNLLGENGRNDNAADPPLPPPPVSVPKQPQSPRTPRQTATSAVSSEKKSRPPSIEIGPWTNMLETTKGWHVPYLNFNIYSCVCVCVGGSSSSSSSYFHFDRTPPT